MFLGKTQVRVVRHGETHDLATVYIEDPAISVLGTNVALNFQWSDWLRVLSHLLDATAELMKDSDAVTAMEARLSAIASKR